MKYLVVVPGNPKPKKRPRFGQGRAYRVDRRDEQAVSWHARQVFRAWPVQGDVKLRAIFYRKDRRRCDTDNLLKLVMDGLNRVAWKDDSQVKEVSVRLEYDSEKPRTELEIEEVAS